MINLTFSIIPNPHTRPNINFLDIHHHTIHAVIMRIFRPCFSGIYPKQTMQNEQKICKHICDAVWIIMKINGNSTVLWFSHALWRKHQKFVLRDLCAVKPVDHYDDVIMSEIASQITSLTIVYLTVLSGADQSKHQSSASLAFVLEIHRWPVNFPHKWPVTRKIFPFDDVIMLCNPAHYISIAERDSSVMSSLCSLNSTDMSTLFCRNMYCSFHSESTLSARCDTTCTQPWQRNNYSIIHSIIPEHGDGVNSWSPFPWKTRTRLFYIVNTMVSDDWAM